MADTTPIVTASPVTATKPVAEKPVEKTTSIVLKNVLTNANVITGYYKDTVDPKTGLTIVGEPMWTSVKYGPGSVTVPESIAEDLLRRDAEATASDANRLVSHERIMDLGKQDGSGYDVEKM